MVEKDAHLSCADTLLPELPIAALLGTQTARILSAGCALNLVQLPSRECDLLLII